MVTFSRLPTALDALGATFFALAFTGLTAAFLTASVFLDLGLITYFFLITFVFLATTFLATGFVSGLAFTTDFDADLTGDLP